MKEPSFILRFEDYTKYVQNQAKNKTGKIKLTEDNNPKCHFN